MAITPRRFGKTTAVAMFCAAFALAVPGSVTAIFSTGRRVNYDDRAATLATLTLTDLGSMPKVHAVVKAAYQAWHEADLKYAGSSLEEIMYMPITNNKYVTINNHMIRTVRTYRISIL